MIPPDRTPPRAPKLLSSEDRIAQWQTLQANLADEADATLDNEPEPAKTGG